MSLRQAIALGAAAALATGVVAALAYRFAGVLVEAMAS